MKGRSFRARLLALWFALAALLALAPSPARADDGPAPAAARDLLDAPDVQLTAPPVPREYVFVRRGAIEISYPAAIESQVRVAVEHADQDARSVAEQLGMRDVPALSVRLVPDPDAMRRLSPPEAPPPAYAVGVAYPSIGLALVSTTAPATREASDVRKTLRHEVSHLMLAEATRRAPLPRWLSEGIAIQQAGEHSLERFKALAVASFTGGLVPLRRLDAAFGGTSDEVEVAYAESADFVAYVMRAEGPSRFGVLAGHLREGLSFDDAVRQTYGSSLAQLEFEWRHDVESRFFAAPLWAGTGSLWLGAIGLMLVGWVRRRRQSQATLARWVREDAARDVLPVTVVAPGPRGVWHGAVLADSPGAAATPGLGAAEGGRRVLAVVTPAMRRADDVAGVGAPRADDAAEPVGGRGVDEDDSVPRISLNGERYTLH